MGNTVTLIVGPDNIQVKTNNGSVSQFCDYLFKYLVNIHHNYVSTDLARSLTLIFTNTY
jgi:hypothetical protein